MIFFRQKYAVFEKFEAYVTEKKQTNNGYEIFSFL